MIMDLNYQLSSYIYTYNKYIYIYIYMHTINIALEATEQSLSHRPLVELDKTEVRRSTTSLSFRAILDATCSPHLANLLSSIDLSDSGRRSYSIYLSGPRSREP